MECGVSANDPLVTKAATVIRSAAPELNHTYSLGLCILFLDRLGDKKDRS